MLCTIAKKNPEAMLEVSEKISALAEEHYWEVKTQCLEFAATILSKFKEHSILLANKDDLKGANGNAPKATSPNSQQQANGNKNGGAMVDKTQIKNAL